MHAKRGKISLDRRGEKKKEIYKNRYDINICTRFTQYKVYRYQV